VNLPRDVNALLDNLLAGIQQVLAEDLVGLYLRGSLATGNFVPEASDLDVLAVTEQPVDDAQFQALAAMHARLAALPNAYANRLEIAYVDRAALKRFTPGVRHPTLGQGEALAWTEHHENWILERWTLREHGVALLGPDLRALIEPITPDEMRAAVRMRLGDWVEWAMDPDDPDWLLPRAHKAYVVETMCRALYTLVYGELSSKKRAVEWALEALPEPWHSTVERSRAWCGDDTVDPAIAPEVRGFVLWAASGGRLDGATELC
jgi:hypothetical protein